MSSIAIATRHTQVYGVNFYSAYCRHASPLVLGCMAKQAKHKIESQSVWERPEPVSRPAPVALSRDMIVQTAMEIADARGLDAVSLRSVGAALHAVPMRLYSYIATKQEMLDLMIDVVYGEMNASGPVPDDWRGALRAFAHRTRQAAQRHPWFSDLLGGCPHQGPNALTHLETSLSALCAILGCKHIDIVFHAAKTVHAYVIGAIQNETRELCQARESGMSKSQWQEANWPYIERMIATGRFPTLALFVTDAIHSPADVVFDSGLDCILDGIELRINRAQTA